MDPCVSAAQTWHGQHFVSCWESVASFAKVFWWLGCVSVVVLLCFCGGVVASLWWRGCVSAVVFLWWCG